MKYKAHPLAMLVVAALGAVASADAGAAARDRSTIAATLPDWSGQWESRLSSEVASGELFRSVKPGEQPELLFLSRMALAGTPPWTPALAEEHRRRVEAWRDEAASRMATVRVCRLSFPTVMESPTSEWTFDALVTPEQTVFVFGTGEVRHIHTDGRSHPSPEDLWPTAMGHSVGHWEHDTLVVDTIGRTEGSLAPGGVGPAASLSSRARFTERIRRLDSDRMVNEMTIEDPGRFATPWRVVLEYRRVRDVDRLLHTDCEENDRNPRIDGRFTISPSSRR